MKKAVLASICCALLAMNVHAQTYPNKIIKLIVPAGAGSASDAIGRLFGQRFGEVIGQPIVIDNRAGAGGRLGPAVAAKSPPDGYTLFLGNSIGLGTLVTTARNLEYDPVADFIPISPVASYQNILVCNPNLPVRTMAELVAYAKQRPNAVRFSTAGLGSGNHFAVELLNMRAGVQMVHVPYKTNAQGMQEVIAGQIECTIESTAGPYVAAGQLRALGVTSLKRNPRLPDVPTLDEQGVKGYDLWWWHALLVPAKTPAPIIEAVRAAAVKVTSDPAWKKRVYEAGFDPREGTPEELAAMIKFEIERYRSIAKAANLKFD
jgi:tripartite-type tricarboxylate transporter receptor subunit TctC